jgi:hypothetical protein
VTLFPVTLTLVMLGRLMKRRVNTPLMPTAARRQVTTAKRR